jgi:hypothetical protein
MSGDNSGAEAVLNALDRWYSRRVNEYYDPIVSLFIYKKIKQEADSLPPREHQQLKGDFVWNFPSRAFPNPCVGFFSCRYKRFEGYLEHAGGSADNTETRELEVMAPAFGVRSACDSLVGVVADLAEGRDMNDIPDEVIDRAFKFVFPDPMSFTVFSLGYLTTRVVSASLRASCAKMTEPEYAMRSRNYTRVSRHVELFSETVFGDIVH